MKNLILTIAIVLISFTFVNAQTAGIIIQPEFNTNNVRKGLFVESTIYKSIGLYSDFKLLNEKENHFRQLNAGVSLKINKNVKTILSTSVINKLATDYFVAPLKDMQKGEYINQDQTFQVGVTYKAEFLTILGGYEFNKHFDNPRVTIGLGFNFNFNYQ